jgi:Zinc-binding dehydrogenase
VEPPQQQAAPILGVTPSGLHPLKAALPGQQLAQRGKRGGGRAERFPHARGDELAQPLPELPCLPGDLIERVASRLSDPRRGRRFNRPRRFQPIYQALPVAHPLNPRTPRCGGCLEEVERQASGVYLTFFGSFVFGKPGFRLSDVPLLVIAADVEAGRYRAKPSRVFRFEDIVEAHRVMESNEANGKIVVIL